MMKFSKREAEAAITMFSHSTRGSAFRTDANVKILTSSYFVKVQTMPGYILHVHKEKGARKPIIYGL